MSWLKYLLAFSLVFNSIVAIAEPSAPAVARMWSLVETLETATKNVKPEPGQTMEQAIEATQKDMLVVVAQQAGLLIPEDLKQFLFESLGRYISNPDERAVLFSVWDMIHVVLTPEFESYEPQFWQPIAEGLGTWMIIFIMIRKPVQLLEKETKNPALVRQIVNSTLSGRWLSKMHITNEFHQAMIQSGLLGVSVAAIAQMSAQMTTHKIDPRPIFKALQITMACDLMNSFVQKDHSTTELTQMLAQSQQLLEQYKSLARMDPNDQRFQSILSGMPKDEQWQDRFGHPLSCNLISLDHLGDHLREDILRYQPAPVEPKTLEQATPP